jgi:hypothetical protein
VQTVWIVVIGGFTGLLGGMFGKGGSAIATPLLHLAGVRSFAAIASPLPATIPSTLIAAWAYQRSKLIDRAVLRTTVLFGVPATVVGAVVTRWTGGSALILVTDVVVAGLGIRVLTSRSHEPLPVDAGAPAGGSTHEPDGGTLGAVSVEAPPRTNPDLVAAVAIVVGLASGLLGNSGGFLLAPLFATVLGLPLKRALGTSLAAAAVLAVPGTIVHAALGHIDWSVTLVFGLASIPLSALGARVALRMATDRLEVVYGVALLLLGGGLLLVH